MNNKTLFDAFEAELRNARAALNNADRYLDTIRTAMDTVVISNLAKNFFPLSTDAEDETIVYGLKVRIVNMELAEALPAI